MEIEKSIPEPSFSPFDLLSNDIKCIILDFLSNNDTKSFSLVCRSFYAIESHHRNLLKPLRLDHFKKVLNRYPNVSNVDLSLCSSVTDALLDLISSYYKEKLRSINFSRRNFYSHVGLTNLVIKCENLVEIDLSMDTKLDDLAAEAIAEAKNLEKLRLVSCASITDVELGYIAVGCSKLKLLSLRCCLGVSDLGVILIAVNCRDIRSLDLSYLRITSKCLPQILELQHLEDLVLEGCEGIVDDSFAAPKQGCISLKKLVISGSEKVRPVCLSSLTSGAADSLQQLILSCSKIDLALVDSLQKFSVLQCISIECCKVTCAGLKAIGNLCISLRELSLNRSRGVMDEGLSSLVTKHKDLRKLNISCCYKVTHVSLAHITSSCTSLVSLKMDNCHSVSAEAFVFIGQKCLFLENLDLTANTIDDRGMRSISRCSRLKSLQLGGCSKITDEGLILVGFFCSNLKELNVQSSTGIGDSSILAIAHGCPDLETIDIGYCESITDGSLMFLSKECSNLKTLKLQGCPLITPLGLALVAMECKQLSELDIRECPKIDDAAMIHLAHFSQNLKKIELSHTSVTDVGLLSLSSIRCLRKMNVFELSGMSPKGLAAALLSFGGLLEVKLDGSYEFLLPKFVIQHLQSVGCFFNWIRMRYR